jgi:CRP-like cAMP-binding protein
MEFTGFRNVLLRHLSSDAVRRLDLREVPLSTHREIESVGGQIPSIVFIEDGIASITTIFRDGLKAEVGMVGYESVLGTSTFFGAQVSPNRVYMQNEGWGYISPTWLARREFVKHGQFQQLVLRYTQAQLIQSMQTAGCNARHKIQQRLARWLLLADDRVAGRRLLVSQEAISEMLGVRRTSVAVAAGKLKDEGLISYSRGKVAVIDRAGLEAKACECYRVVRDHLHNYEDGQGSFGLSPSSLRESKSTSSPGSQ